MTYVSRFSALCRMKIRALHKDAKMYGVCRGVLLKLLGITGYIEVAFEMLAESIWQKAALLWPRDAMMGQHPPLLISAI